MHRYTDCVIRGWDSAQVYRLCDKRLGQCTAITVLLKFQGYSLNYFFQAILQTPIASVSLLLESGRYRALFLITIYNDKIKKVCHHCALHDCIFVIVKMYPQ